MPKRVGWQPIPKVKLKDTIFVELDLTKEEDEVDFCLLDEMFCRKEEDIKAEQERQNAKKQREQQNSRLQRTVLEPKHIMDSAMAIASAKLTATEVVDALTSLDDLTLNAEAAEKILRIFPDEAQTKLLEENRDKAEELS